MLIHHAWLGLLTYIRWNSKKIMCKWLSRCGVSLSLFGAINESACMIPCHLLQGVFHAHHTINFYVRDPPALMSGLKLKSHHVRVVFGICLAPINKGLWILKPGPCPITSSSVTKHFDVKKKKGLNYVDANMKEERKSTGNHCCSIWRMIQVVCICRFINLVGTYYPMQVPLSSLFFIHHS